MLSPRICLIAAFIAASALTCQAGNGFLHTGDTATGANDAQQTATTDKLIKSLDTIVEEGHDAQTEIAQADKDDTETQASSASNQDVEDDGENQSETSAQAEDDESTSSNNADDDATISESSDSLTINNELLQQAGSWESLLQTSSVDATGGSEGDDDAVETGDQELDAVLKDGAEAALPDENLDAEDAKIVYGGSENEEQLVEDLEAESSDSEAESFLQTSSATVASKGDDDAVENADQELDAVLKDGADAAIPDENLDADDAKIVYGGSENEEQLVEDLEAQSDDSEDSEAEATNSEDSETESESLLQTKATAGAKGDDDAVENADQELDAVLKDGADAAIPDENLDADDAKIVYGSSENEEQLVEDLEAQSDDSEDSEAEATNSEDSESESESLLQTKATAGAKGDDDAVENADQELDAVLKDGADAAIPDENLDADDAKIVYGGSENEEQLVEDLEAESSESETDSSESDADAE